MFRIWVPNNTTQTFDDFSRDLKFHKLEWETNKLSSSVIFLDMVLTIQDNRIITKLYKKILNLYLYISPFSAHSPGVLSGLIIGNVLRIHHLCTEKSVRKEFYKKFFLRLRAHGYLPSKLNPLFKHGLKLASYKPMPSTKRIRQNRLRLQTSGIPTNSAGNDMAILHIPYHSKDPISREIQTIFHEKFLASNTATASFKRLVIAYSRPRNLGEMLSYQRIDSYNCQPVSSNFVTRDTAIYLSLLNPLNSYLSFF